MKQWTLFCYLFLSRSRSLDLLRERRLRLGDRLRLLNVQNKLEMEEIRNKVVICLLRLFSGLLLLLLRLSLLGLLDLPNRAG